jgi:hypothetical protein
MKKEHKIMSEEGQVWRTEVGGFYGPVLAQAKVPNSI